MCAYNFNFCTPFSLLCIENDTLARGDMEFLSLCSTSYLTSDEKRREISYLQATMYYFINYINTLLKQEEADLIHVS